jgi:hypothetical protein
MKLFYDLRLGYFVTAPGQESELIGLQAKAGDTEEVIVQFGRSSDPTGSEAIIGAPTWTAENLAGGTVITIGIKEEGEYSDGTILASTSTFTHNSTDKLYTFGLGLNTTAINTALERLDTNAADDIASLDCNFELTFQVGGSGGWRSSVLPVPFTLYHDVLGGSEGTPANADDPDEYLLKASGIEWLPTVTSKTGGTSADFDAIPTVAVTVGKLFAFSDQDSLPATVRLYRLESGTDAESAPDVIRPDDYATTTNEKVWKLQVFGASVSGDVFGPASSVNNQVALFDGATGKLLKSSGTTLGDAAAKNTGTTAGTLCAGDDSRLSNSRTPTAHASTHQSGGSDVIKLDDLGTPDDNTDLNATTGRHGLLPKLGGGTTNFLRADGTWAAPSGGSPVPTSVTVKTSTSFEVFNSDSGALLEFDTSGGSVTGTIPPQSSESYAAGMHFWVRCTSAANTASLARGSGVDLYNDSLSSADITLTAGKLYHIWRRAEDVWVVLSAS